MKLFTEISGTLYKILMTLNLPPGFDCVQATPLFCQSHSPNTMIIGCFFFRLKESILVLPSAVCVSVCARMCVSLKLAMGC